MEKKILVIDDSETIRKSFVLSLKDTEYRVDTADSGLQGIAMARKGHYNLIFLDLKMPGMDGVETLRELRKIDQEVTIYIVTAFYTEFFEPLLEAKKDGLNFEVVRKPMAHEDVMRVIKEILAGPGKLPRKSNGKFIFKLFVAGKTPRAEKTEQLVRSILDDTLKERYLLLTVDIMQNPGAAYDENVFATPTLIKKFPEPSKRVMGDLSNRERVLIHLGIAS